MSDVTEILLAIETGDPSAADQLLPLVYAELRKLAAQRLAWEKPGQTLQATALVHEAYLRLVGPDMARSWDGRGPFLRRRRRVDAPDRYREAHRRKLCGKHGGGRVRLFEGWDVAAPERPETLVAVDESLDRLAAASPRVAELVKLRFFAGFSSVEAASLLGISPRKADQLWAYARAWLREELGDDGRR